MLIDSRLKPELCCKKPPTAPESGEAVTHHQLEHVLILNGLPGVTPREVGEDERPGVAFASDGRMAVAVPVTLQLRYLEEDGQTLGNAVQDVPGPMIPAALAHARKNLVAPKTASIELGDETITPDFAAFQRRLPGVDMGDITIDPAKLTENLGPTRLTSSVTLCPYRLLAIAKAMGVKAGDGVTLLLRGDTAPMSVLPLRTDACFQGEALGVLMPIAPARDPELIPDAGQPSTPQERGFLFEVEDPEDGAAGNAVPEGED